MWHGFTCRSLGLHQFFYVINFVALFYLHVVFQEGGSLFPADDNGKQLYSDIDYIETWPALEECVKLGLTKSIGLSNFSKDQTERILSVATIPPANNQVLFLYFWVLWL